MKTPTDRLSELIQNTLKGVEDEYEMGGLSSGLYGDYASDVARNVVIAVLQEQKAVVEGSKKNDMNWPFDWDQHETHFRAGEEAGYNKALQDYKHSLEETIKEWEKVV